VLGVHSGHDSSACLFCDNQLVIAIEKERLSRKKHDSGEPIECIEYILKEAELEYSDIDLVVRVNWFNSNELNDEYYKVFKNVIVRYEHHLFHAYAVTLVMDGEGIIYIVDGRGCRPKDNGEKSNMDIFETESVYKYDGCIISALEKKYAEHIVGEYKWGSHMDSIGYIYADVSRMIFQDYNAAGKVMALASYGRTNSNIPPIIKYDNDDIFSVSKEWLQFLNQQEFPIDYHSQLAKDISYSLQNEVEKYFEFRVNTLISKYKSNSIAISGGVALNCKNNGELMRKCNIDKLGIFPACGDNGISVGAAVWAIRELYHDRRKLKWRFDLGKTYSKLNQSKVDIEKIVDLIYKGNVVGIFENGSEYGPRALCNRSLLALPSKGMKDYLNMKVKKRERFRPFGGVVLERNIGKLTRETVSNDYMLIAVKARDDIIRTLPDLVHIDGTIRIQVVREDRKNTSIYRILDILERKYGSFLLINTSFNDKGEPIVEQPDEAISTAKKIGVKYILLNGIIERVMW
jgi:carbamoyltransferase